MQPQRHQTTRVLWLLALIIPLLAAGCSSNPKSHIGAFSQASANLAGEAKRGYQLVHDSTYEKKLYDLAADTSIKIDDVNRMNSMLQVKLQPELEKRIDALEAIQNYAKALSDLSSADFRKDMDKATMDLNGALKGLNKTVGKVGGSKVISDSSLGIIATAVDAIGTVIQEKMRRKAIKEIVIQANPTIQEVCSHVKGEYSNLIPFVQANLEKIYYEKISDYESHKNKLQLDNRVALIREIHDRMKATSLLKDYSAKLAGAVDELANSHTELFKAVTDDKFTTKKLVSKIGEMVEFGKSIKSLNDKIAAK